MPELKDELVFVVRMDASTKPGGDLVQVDEYIRVLGALGRTARRMSWRPEMTLPANVVAVNIDRPFETLDLLRRVEPGRLVILTIHHSHAAISHLRQGESSASLARRVLAGLPLQLREYLTFARRLLIHREGGPSIWPTLARALWDCLFYKSRIRRALVRSRAVIVLSDTERQALASDFGAELEHVVLAPNGLPEYDDSLPHVEWETRQGAVVVGRIEPRKRQLELLEAADARGLALTFVGALDANSGLYGERFVKAVDASPFSTWLGAMSHSDVVSLLSRSRVLANASWAEVQSLVELEAASAGCYVVTTDSGSAREFLGSGAAVLASARDLGPLVSAVDTALRAELPPPEFRYAHTWLSSAQAIAELFERDGSTP